MQWALVFWCNLTIVELWLDKQPKPLSPRWLGGRRESGVRSLRTVWRLWSVGLHEWDWTPKSMLVVMMSFCEHLSLPAAEDALNHSWPCHHLSQFEPESCGTLSARLHKGFVTGWHDDCGDRSELKQIILYLLLLRALLELCSKHLFVFVCFCVYTGGYVLALRCCWSVSLPKEDWDGILPPAWTEWCVCLTIQARLESVVMQLTLMQCLSKYRPICFLSIQTLEWKYFFIILMSKSYILSLLRSQNHSLKNSQIHISPPSPQNKQMKKDTRGGESFVLLLTF